MPKLVLTPDQQKFVDAIWVLCQALYVITLFLYIRAIHSIAGKTKQYRLGDLAPIWICRLPRAFTSRARYEAEKREYRLLHDVINGSSTLKRQYYYYYRYIARKYNWTYTKEIYDPDN